MKNTFLSVLLLISGFNPGRAQMSQNAKDSAVIGIWKGTSICQVKNSPCYDEVVVYYITKGNGADSFNIRADKIVNGVEEDMGILPCILDRKNNRLISAGKRGTWTFNVKDRAIDGTLIVDGALYRIVKLSRQG